MNFPKTTKRFCLSIFLLSLALPLLANSSDIDDRLKNAEAIKTSDVKTFSGILLELRSLSNEFSFEQKYYFLYLTGYEFSYQGKLDQAIASYQEVFSNSTIKSMKYRSALSLINIYAVTKEWDKGFEYIDYILNIRNEISDKKIRHLGMLAVTIFQVEVEQYAQALNIIRQLKKEKVFGRNKCLAFGLELKALLNSSPEKLSINQFGIAIEFCTMEGESVVANVIRSNLAQYFVDQADYENAINVLFKNMPSIHDSKYKLLIIDAHSIIAKAYFGIGNLELAKRHAIQVTTKYRNVNYVKPLVDSYYVLYQIALKLEDFKAAIRYLKSYIEVEKIRFEEVKAKQLAFRRARMELLDKNNQIELLNKQNQILQLEQKYSKEESEANRAIIGLLALSVSLTLLWLFYVRRSQRRLKYLAEYDGLTRICNRTHFTESARTVLKNYSKSNFPVSLIVFDLDHFKRVNDTFGHNAGDKVLQLTAHECSTCVRKADIFGRIGGEEFAILLPQCDIEQAVKIAEECRLNINQIDTTDCGFDFEVSASFGVTEAKNNGYDLKDLLAQADKLMYSAKNKGRNQVIS